MELKERLQDYTRLEFMSLVNQIKQVDLSQDMHNRLIQYFDRIVGHPKGADLLFYPDEDEFSDGHDAVTTILHRVKQWQNSKGQPAFKDDALKNADERSNPPLRAIDRAWKKSSENLVKVQQIAATINESKQQAENALNRFEAFLNTIEGRHQTLAQEIPAKKNVSELNRCVREFDAAQHAMIMSVQRYTFKDSAVKFAKDDAQRSISYSHLDRDLQKKVLEHITHTSNLYLAQRTILVTRQQELHTRAEATLEHITELRVRTAAIIERGSPEGRHFVSSTNEADFGPCILTTEPNLSTLCKRAAPDLTNTLRSAIGGLAWSSTTADAQTVNYTSILSFQFDRTGCIEPYAITLPLSELEPIEGRNWLLLADMKAEIDLSFRMAPGAIISNPLHVSYSLKKIEKLSQIYLVSTYNQIVSSKVRVCNAEWETQSETYRFVRPGTVADVITWALPATQDLTVTDPERIPSLGYIAPASVPYVNQVDVIEDLLFDDYIVVFPAEAKIDPVYVMFRGQREYAGIASGGHTLTSGHWPNSNTSDTGTGIPPHIARQLHNRIFKHFTEFREALWKTVASNPESSAQFSTENINSMKEGRAPSTGQHPTETFEIKHIVPPEEGGDIYDMDNMHVWVRRLA